MSAPTIRPDGPPPHLTCGLLAWECERDFIDLWQAYLTGQDPIGPAETGLVEQLVWLDWRRRRLKLGERALHMASLDRATSGERNDRLTRRALALTDETRPELSSIGAVRADDEGDARDQSEWESMLEAARATEALIDGQG